jgi:hypothetical protein
MSSNAKKTTRIRSRKTKPNKANRKADLKRIQSNSKLLKEFAENNDK